MRSIYKTLAEVKVLHEYYLTEADGKTIFDYSGQEEKMKFLERFLSANRPMIEGDIAFDIPLSFSDTFRNNRLRLIPSYSGFRIMAEVEEVRASDNSITYRPMTPIAPDEMLVIGLRKKNSSLNVFSNERINTPFPSIYLFSNTGAADSVSFPSLSAAIPDYSALNTYEQGELTLDGSGNIQSFYTDEHGKSAMAPTLWR
jgi:hypothetical protein